MTASTPTPSALHGALPDSRPARNAILGALRAAAPAQPLPVPSLAEFHAGPFGRGMPGGAALAIEPAELIARFETNAASWRAEVWQAGPASWPDALAQALARHGCRRVAIGAGSELLPELDPALEAFQVRRFDEALEGWKAELFEGVDAGITSAAAGVADTGSLVLTPGPGEPRSLSLVPPVHVAVLRSSRLHASLPAAWAALGFTGTLNGERTPLPTNLLLVTGPSKTADIQQVLAYGAHGPKVLVIVLVLDGEPVSVGATFSEASS